MTERVRASSSRAAGTTRATGTARTAGVTPARAGGAAGGTSRRLVVVPDASPTTAGTTRRPGTTAGPAAAPDPSHADRARTIRVPWTAPAVPKVRRIVVEDLEGRGLPDEIVGESEIVVSELVGNAIRHARPLADGTVRVHWKVKAGVVEIEVSDGGGHSTPRPAPRSVWASSGRGLRIVRSLAHEWGVAEERNGRTVWASLGGPSRRRSR